MLGLPCWRQIFAVTDCINNQKNLIRRPVCGVLVLFRGVTIYDATRGVCGNPFTSRSILSGRFGRGISQSQDQDDELQDQRQVGQRVARRDGPQRTEARVPDAIAQTGYTVSWEVDWRERDGSCLIANASALLTITYNYPEVSNALSADLKRRWQRFMAGVRKHEETHGRLAREMVAAAKRLTHLSIKNDSGCHKTQAEMKRRIAAVYDRYEARQLEFDDVEHSEGGNVERLVNRLSGNPLLGRR